MSSIHYLLHTHLYVLMLTVRQLSSACEPVRDVGGLNRSKPRNSISQTRSSWKATFNIHLCSSTDIFLTTPWFNMIMTNGSVIRAEECGILRSRVRRFLQFGRRKLVPYILNFDVDLQRQTICTPSLVHISVVRSSMSQSTNPRVWRYTEQQFKASGTVNNSR